uniref:zinc finger domain-containing protein n=1 Tax=Propioniciclava sp. TaxID=2038686 RepID=UPI00262F0E85
MSEPTANTCPACHAAPGQPCTTKSGGRATATHKARLEAVADAAPECPRKHTAPGAIARCAAYY